jgi:hypothetical protein
MIPNQVHKFNQLQTLTKQMSSEIDTIQRLSVPKMEDKHQIVNCECEAPVERTCIYCHEVYCHNCIHELQQIHGHLLCSLCSDNYILDGAHAIEDQENEE